MSSTLVDEEPDKNKKIMLCRLCLQERLMPFFFKQFMTVAILVALLVGFVFPRLGFWVGSFEGSTYICIIMIFLHSGLKLKTEALKEAIKQWRAFLYGVTSITLVTSLVGTKLTQLLPFEESQPKMKDDNTTSSFSGDSILGPREFLLGMQLYYVAPSAIAAGVVLTSLAGGDVTVALLLTVTTNILGVVTVPLLATWLVAVKGVKIDIVNLLVKLSSTVLVPLIVGKLLTRHKMVKTFVRDYSKTLKLASIVFLVCIPWMKISKAKLQGSFEAVSILNLVIAVLWGIAIHLIMLGINYVGAWLIRVSVPTRKAVVILASTKTLAITLSVISFLPTNFGDAGLMSLPIILMHLTLLTLDSVWVVHWNTSHNDKEEEVENSVDDVNSTHFTSHNTVHITSV